MSEFALKVQNISKSFKISNHHYDGLRYYFFNLFEKREKPQKFQALKDISFEVKKGEFFSIIGKNGSGKSTLLKIIAGIYQPDSGDIEVNGKIVPFLELGVGFNYELTARENIFLNGIILGLTRKEVEAKYDQILDFAEVREFEDLPLKNFSSGMQVRLAFSVAIQADGDIYLLDEVFAVGDLAFQQKSLKVIEETIQKGKTIIFVGHEMGKIKKYSSNILYIKDHGVEMIGKDAVERYLRDLEINQNNP